MATKQEWQEYFKLINDREPSLSEYEAAVANGEITDGPTQTAPQPPFQQTYQQPQQFQQNSYPQPGMNAYGGPQTPEQMDVANNKVYAVLAYLGWLVLIPIFAAKTSPFARFHANQGLVLAIFGTGGNIVFWIFSFLAASSFNFGLASVIGIFQFLWAIVIIVFAIIGIVSAAQGTRKALPAIGTIQVLK
jgi:uncharacterized membrane protein